MKYLLLEPRVKAIAPNIALMKWARWCENKEYPYQYVRGKVRKEKIPFEPDIILMSCIFSFYSERYRDTIEYYLSEEIYPGAKFIVGGVFPTLYKDWFLSKDKSWNDRNISVYKKWFDSDDKKRLEISCGIAEEIEFLSPKYNVDIISEDNDPYPRDKIVMYASRGCVNKCGYCAVPILEGNMRSFTTIADSIEQGKKELPDAKSLVLYDNNFTEHEFFDDIINEIKDSGLPVDIHGLHVESFTEHHAKRFSELEWAAQGEHGTPYLRFSFDWMKYAPQVERAYDIYMQYDIKAGFFCYMLFNWIDTPEDFWQRIEKCQQIIDKYSDKGKPIFLFPQRYEPFKPKSKDKTQQGLKRNQYISPKWNNYVEKRWPIEFIDEHGKKHKVTGSDLVRGITRMYTWIHGFISVTKSKNIFNWIGKDCDEFLYRAVNMAVNKKYRLEKLDDKREILFKECKYKPERIIKSKIRKIRKIT